MDEPLVAGQDLLLVNENTNRSTESRVVYAKKERDGHFYVGVEFVNAENNFWKMTFPLPGARPLRRPLGSKALPASVFRFPRFLLFALSLLFSFSFFFSSFPLPSVL